MHQKSASLHRISKLPSAHPSITVLEP